MRKKFRPFNLIVFGGSGDLALRKICPSLYERFLDGHLDVAFSIVPIYRSDDDAADLMERIHRFIEMEVGKRFSEKTFAAFAEHIKLIKVADQTEADFKELKAFVKKEPDFQNVYYLSTPSFVYGPIALTLKKCGMVNKLSKVVLEKPLGYSLKSSEEINEQVGEAFTESQIYRIDHYLGKETVQNLMVLRFANNLFERAWDAEHIDNIQITVAESLGVENRVEYYDKSGALRDMVQNHLLQLLCLVAMEPPFTLDANNVRDEKLKILKALRPFNKRSVVSDTVKGQYTRGTIDGKKVNSYLEDIGTYESDTETFVALKTYVDNWRWKNVPFYLRTGKRMAARYSEIVINFNPVRHNIFDFKEKLLNNQLIIRLQPEERIELVQMTKIPGPGGYRFKPISLKLDYVDSFKERLPGAYERLIADVLKGDQTLFMRHDELSAAWEWTESVSTHWELKEVQNVLYTAGSEGPGDKIMSGEDSWPENRSA